MQQTPEHGQGQTGASQASGESCVAERVLAALEHALTQGTGANPLLIRRIARKLGMSARTLQRRLRASGTSFFLLLRQTRERHAVQALSQDGRRLCEIAEQLAFSEHSAFSRAFKRWTGMPPKRFRVLLAHGPARFDDAARVRCGTQLPPCSLPDDGDGS